MDHIASWRPHGRCFMVHDHLELQKYALPIWFRHSNHASFQRQLNLYSFVRCNQGKDKGAYYHPLFLRGKPFLAQRMKRNKTKKRVTRKVVPNMEPNFYSMKSLPPGPSTTRESGESKQVPTPVTPPGKATEAHSGSHKHVSMPAPAPPLPARQILPTMATMPAMPRAQQLQHTLQTPSQSMQLLNHYNPRTSEQECVVLAVLRPSSTNTTASPMMMRDPRYDLGMTTSNFLNRQRMMQQMRPLQTIQPLHNLHPMRSLLPGSLGFPPAWKRSI